MNNAQLITNIKAICKRKNISLGTMLENCNLSKGFIYDVEKRDRTPSIDKISAISEYLGVSVDYLLGRVDEPTATIKTVQGYALPKILEEQNNLDELSKELLKTFKKLSFRDKISVLNYALNIESPPQIVQTKKQEVKGPEQVHYVARGGQSTKGIINISDEDLLKGETDDYDKY